jgi:menaquinone-9 beta-reductase
LYNHNSLHSAVLPNSNQVAIIGGGLAGLTSALKLAQQNISVTLIEKKSYPFHRVCGEYISNEALPFLRSIGADPAPLKPAVISKFILSSPTGNTLQANLDLGGFGISRFSLDNYLYQLAVARGVNFRLQTQVQDIKFKDDSFKLKLSNGEELHANVALGAYGKRANLDRQLNRKFFRARSPYIGVKYHIRYNQPQDLIALHNFKDGYAGISAIENGSYCFCYLTTRQNLRDHGSIPSMEKAILYKNPYLQQIFEEGEFLYEQPEVINEISFATKTSIENHMLMCGDAAGMIAPLCGNGMAMAIHGGKIAAEHVADYFNYNQPRQTLENNFRKSWQNQFENRLTLGRTVQHLFGHPFLSEIAVSTLKHFPAAVRLIMKQTHGTPF